MRVVAWLLVVVMSLPGALAWDQLRGAGDRSQNIAPSSGTLDVTAVYETARDLAGRKVLEGRASPLAVAADGYLWTLAHEANACWPLRTDAAGGTTPMPTFTCRDGRLQGIVDGLLLVCQSGPPGAAIFAAYRSSDGSLAWAVRPETAFSLADGPEAAVPGEWVWTCDGTAIGDARIVVPFAAVGRGLDAPLGGQAFRHRIAAFTMGGNLVWDSSVGAAAMASTSAGDPTPMDLGDLAFVPLAVTLADQGIVASGWAACPGDHTCQDRTDPQGPMGALAWLRDDGTVVAATLAKPDLDDDPEAAQEPVHAPPHVSSFGAARGNLVVAQAGARILQIDPGSPQLEEDIGAPVLKHTSGPLTVWPGPVWQEQRIAVPTDRVINFLPLGAYRGVPSWESADRFEPIVDLIGDRLGRLYILTIRTTDQNGTTTELYSREAKLTVLDRDGDTLHELPLRADTRIDTDAAFSAGFGNTDALRWLVTPKFVEHQGTLYVVDAWGRIIVLADSDEEPAVRIDNRYPAAGDQITLDVQRHGDPLRVTIRWGDGNTESAPWPGGAARFQARHLYVASAVHDGAVTILDQDGTTATAGFTVNVGGVPPPKLSPIQKAFSDQYEDTTWGIIGLVLAGLGGFYGFIRFRRGQSKLRQGIRRLQEIRDLARKDPVAGLSELQELRRYVHDRAAAGYYDQSQMQVLETRAATAARTILFHSVESFRNRLTPVYQGLLASIFEDGIIGDHEAQVALAGLTEQRKLTVAEKDLLTRLIHVLNP